MNSPLIFRIFKNNQLVGVKQFDQESIVVGHKADVQLDLDSDEVSPIHCLIELRDNGYYICDLGSVTGTFKNGQAVLDEIIESGDELVIGPFKVVFFIGAPKPKIVPGSQPVVNQVKTATPLVSSQPKLELAAMPPAAVVKTEEIKIVSPAATPLLPVEAPRVEEKPVKSIAPVRPEIKKERISYKKRKGEKTFSPVSEVQDLRAFLKPGKGNVVEVLVAWKERILNTYHFKGTKSIRVNSGNSEQISLPDGILPRGYCLMELAGGLKVNVTSEMQTELVSALGVEPVENLAAKGKVQRSGAGNCVRVDQGEMLCLTLPGGNLFIYIRFVAQPPVVPVIPVAFSGTEFTGLVMSLVIVGLLAFYISATTPKDWEENKQEDVVHIAQVVFNNPPPPPPEPPPKQELPPPEPVKTPPPPPPQPKKVIVSDLNKDSQKKGPMGPQGAKDEVAARAAEVAPKPNAKNSPKKFTSTRQGGAIKTGSTSGANAKSANKDLSKVGLFSAFGGGGSRANVDKAYSGAGEVLGMADKATGTSGFNEDRAGDDLGSKFKDSGAGGKGTSTQGISGVGTKGRASGQSAYGAANGFGGKSSVAISGGGFEESFDGTIDKEAIRRVIKAKLHEVKSCYERVLNTMERGRKLEGKIVLGWEIIEKGQARNVKVKSSTLGNSQVENCIRDRLASWTFPEPPPGMVADVQAYPFVMNQSN